MSDTRITNHLSTGGPDDELESLGVGRPSSHAVLGVLEHLLQTEDDANAPQAPMPRGTLSEEVAKPAANQVEASRGGCLSSVHVFGMLRSDLDVRNVGHRLDREEPP